MTDRAMEAAARVWCFYGMIEGADGILVMERAGVCGCKSSGDCYDWRVDLPIAQAAITAHLSEPDEERVERVRDAIIADLHRTADDEGTDEFYEQIARAAIKAMSPDGG